VREEVFKLREASVALIVLIDMGDEDFIEQWHKKFIHLRTSDDEDLGVDEWDVFELIHGVDDFRPLGAPRWIAGKNDALSMREREADRVPSFPSHKDRVTCGVAFEEFEVFREMPWEGSIFTDDSVGSHGDDSGEFEVREHESKPISTALSGARQG